MLWWWGFSERLQVKELQLDPGGKELESGGVRAGTKWSEYGQLLPIGK